MIRTMAVIIRQEFQLLLVDPFPFMLLVVMPLALVPFFTGGLIGGAVTSVPGLAALFGFLGTSVVGFVFFRDHGWRTWERLRISGAPPSAIILGKAASLWLLFAAQQTILLIVGWTVLGMPWSGTVPAGVLMVLVVAVTQVSLGLLVSTYATNIHHVNVITQLGGLLMAGIGGAITPLTLFPDWVQRLAPLTPVYWALKGMRGVLALGWGVTEVLQPLAILSGISLTAFLLTLRRYRYDEPKTYYA